MRAAGRKAASGCPLKRAGALSPAATIDRMLKRRDFLAAAQARSFAARGVVVQMRDRKDGKPARLGFTVTKKVGNAVVRNRARRRLKEAARLSLPSLGLSGWDLVLIGRDGTGKRPFGQLIGDLRGALKQVGALP